MAYEGFDQTSDYSVLNNEAIYDDFYLSIHDDLFPFDREKNIIDSVLANTQAVPETSRILIIGCSSGKSLDYFLEKGFKHVKCIDRTNAAGNYSHSPVIVGDAADAMMFDKGEFTHIFCLGETIYENREKTDIFKNCREWLEYGGYFIISLVTPKIYSFIPSGAMKIDDPEETNMAHVDFDDFEYRCSAILPGNTSSEIERKETFTDKKTRKVRENIQSLYVESREKIVNDIKMCGFLEKGEFEHKHGMKTGIWTRS